MEEREGKASKLRKLEHFRRQLPYLSCKALQDVITLVKESGCPDLHSRKNIKEAVQVTLDDFQGYGPVVQNVEVTTLTGGCKTLPMISLPSLLQGCFQDGGYLCQLVTKMHNQRPSSFLAPWRGIVYGDELHPGNQLSGTGRKTWIIYFSWLELTPKLLSDEKHWFTLMVVRSNEVSGIEAGISQCIRVLLERMFTDEHGSPLNGIFLRSQDQSIRLFWTLSFHLMDGGAMRQTWLSRQDSGSRTCQLCKNIFNLQSANENNEDDLKISSKYILFNQLKICTDQEILDSWKRLEEREKTETKSMMKRWQQACGFSYHPRGLLASACLAGLGLLRPSSGYLHDWMHGMVSHGVLNHIMQWLLDFLVKSGMPNIWQTLQQYFQLWTWPGALPGTGALHKLFNHKKAQLKASASQMLSLYPVVEYFTRTCCLLPECQATKDMFLAWCSVMDILVASSNIVPVAGHLQLAVETALNLTVQAGFGNSMVPKFHWCLHYEAPMQNLAGLPSTWATERKHKIARRYGNNLFNTSQYEDTLLKEITASHVAFLREDAEYKHGSHLLEPYTASKKLHAYLHSNNIVRQDQHCEASSKAKLDSGHVCKVGDFVLYKVSNEERADLPLGCGHLECFLQTDGLKVAIVEPLSLKEFSLDMKVAKWTPIPNALHVVELEIVAAAVLYNKAKDGTTTTLLPPHVTQKLGRKMHNTLID